MLVNYSEIKSFDDREQVLQGQPGSCVRLQKGQSHLNPSLALQSEQSQMLGFGSDLLASCFTLATSDLDLGSELKPPTGIFNREKAEASFEFKTMQ